MVLAAVRRSGVPMQRIRPALKSLEQEIGLRHALASRRLYTDGAELLYDYAERQFGSEESALVMQLVVVRSGQGVFKEAVMEYLRRIEYASDGYAARISVPAYTRAEVVADPEMSFGSPVFVRGGCRVDDVLHRFWAGESIKDLYKSSGRHPTNWKMWYVSHPAELPVLPRGGWLPYLANPTREAATTTGCWEGIGSKRTRRPGERGFRTRRRPPRPSVRHRL